MLRLEGKVALVSGASKGIKEGIAKGLAAAGASVAVNYASDQRGAEAVVAAITPRRQGNRGPRRRLKVSRRGAAFRRSQGRLRCARRARKQCRGLQGRAAT